MTITAIIVIVLLAIMAGSLVVMAMSSVGAGKRYDEDVARDYAKMRAQLDQQSERADHGAA